MTNFNLNKTLNHPHHHHPPRTTPIRALLRTTALLLCLLPGWAFGQITFDFEDNTTGIDGSNNLTQTVGRYTLNGSAQGYGITWYDNNTGTDTEVAYNLATYMTFYLADERAFDLGSIYMKNLRASSGDDFVITVQSAEGTTSDVNITISSSAANTYDFTSDDTFKNIVSITIQSAISGNYISLMFDDITLTPISSDIEVSVDSPELDEGDAGTTTMDFTVSLSDAAPTGGATVDYSLTAGTATAGVDYVDASGTVTFDEGDTEKTVSITIQDDAIVEPDETFTLTLTNPTGTDVILSDDAYKGTATITDDDKAAVTFTDISGDEDDGAITVTATLDHAVQGGFTVDVSTVDNSATVANSDYTAVSGETLTFTGTAGEKQTFTVTPTADAILEGDENLSVKMTNLSTDLDVTITDNGTITIANDDDATITIADVSGDEDDGAMTLTAVLDHAVQGSFTVKVSNTTEGTATAGTDYTAVSTTLTFAGTAGEKQTFTVTPTADTDPEADETIVLAMSVLTTPLPVDITDQATVTILDDDVAQFAINNVGAYEGSTGTTTFTFTVSLDKTLTETVTVDYATTDGTAKAGSDYTAASGTLTFAAGETSKDISVLVTGDAIVEPTETFTVTLSNTTGSSVEINTTKSTGTGTINDDDHADVTLTQISGHEDDGTLTVVATLSNAVEDGFTVDLYTTDVSATVADNDYTAISNETLTFTGTAGETQNLTVTPTADEKLEGDEVFTVSMRNLSTSLSVSTTSVVPVTIFNDDTAAITIADVSSDEDAGTITLTATLDHAVADAFTVTVSNTSEGTATAGTDYTALSETLTFTGTAGETQTFTLTPTVDAVTEEDETIVIALSNLAGTTLSVDITDEATITLVNDDHTPVITAGQIFNITATATNGDTAATLEATDDDNDALQDWTIVTGNTDVDGDGNVPFTLSDGTVTINDVDDLFSDQTSFTLVITVSDGTNTSAATDVLITTEKLTQTITFAAIDDQLVTNGTVTLVATGGASGNAVTFTLATAPTTGVASITDNLITLLGPGTVTVTASQAGNDVYEAADPVTQTFTINAATLLVPTLFTPNGDGTNDRFIIRGGGSVATITFAIYDRAGNEVFRSANWTLLSSEGWDGTHHGTKQPQGAYVWVVNGSLSDGTNLTIDGKRTGIIRLAR